MKKFLRLISVLFLGGVLFNPAQAQNQQKIDSLLNVLKTAKEDTNKVNTLNILSNQLMGTGDYKKATKYADDELHLSKKINYKKGEADAYTNIGIICSDQGNYSEALKNYFDALKIREERDDKRSIALTYNRIGIVYRGQADYPKALDYYFMALKMNEELIDKKEIARNLGNIGIIFLKQGNRPEALKNYFRALKIFEEMGDKPGKAASNVNIGNIYFAQGNYTEALKNYFAALKFFEEIGDKRAVAFSYTNIGNIYREQGNSTEAIKNYFASLKIHEEIGNKLGIVITHHSLGNIYYDKGNYSEALKFFFTSLKTSEEIGNKDAIARANIVLGNVNVKLKKFSEAKKYLDNALSLSKKIGSIENIQQSYGGLAELDSCAGNYSQSLEHYKLYIVYKDSLLNESTGKQIIEMKTKYESEKKEKEIALLTKDKEVQNVEIKKQKLLKNSFIGGLVLLLILSYFVYNNLRIVNKLKLQNIRNKIASDLHDDVGSTLNSISVYSEVAKQKSPAVVDELEQIGEASRKIIEVMSDIVWTINPKNDTFENIISRMATLAYNLLKAKNIEHIFQADETLNETKLSLESRRNFYLIFKEALNNLVKYSQATSAFITLTNENGLIKLAVRDNGVGFDIVETSKGNGLLNMKDRAKEMKAQLRIESVKGNGTNVELIFKA